MTAASVRAQDGLLPRAVQDRIFAAGAVCMGAAIAWLDPVLLTMATLTVSVFAAGLFWPAGAVAAVVASVPVQDRWAVSFGGTELTWTKALTLALSAVLALRVLLGGSRLRFPPLALAHVLVCASLVVSVVNTIDLGGWSQESYRWAAAAAVLIAAVAFIDSPTDEKAVLSALAAGVTLCFGLGLHQAITGSGPPTFVERGVTRAHAWFGEPNPLAAYAAIATLTLLAARAGNVGRAPALRPRMFSTVMLGSAGLGAVTVLLTQSEGGIAALFGGGLVLAWRLAGFRLRRAIATAGVAAALVALLSLAVGSGRVNLATAIPNSAQGVSSANFAERERVAHWDAAFEMWQAYPWFGVGAGNFDARFREFTTEWRFRIPRGHAHNAYLQAAAQAGAIGFAAYAGLLATATLGLMRRGSISERRAGAGLQAGALAATVAVAIHGLVEYVHVLSIGIALAGVWALGLRARDRDENEFDQHVGG